MKQQLDISTWVRKDHFNFFRKFEEPYYGVCVNIDCTIAYQRAKEKNVSFYIYYLHKALAAAQVVEAFKLRIEGDEVYIYDRIDSGSTISRANGTFGFGDYIYSPSLEEFVSNATHVMERVQNRDDLERSSAKNLIRFSALPWINFTALSHARMFTFSDSCPKISFGKLTTDNEKRMMPVSIHVHHALVDGIHLGEYIDKYQELMNE